MVKRCAAPEASICKGSGNSSRENAIKYARGKEQTVIEETACPELDSESVDSGYKWPDLLKHH
ncbi:hypothetical protein SBDP1_870004 [Syntrophobacter sp. SbD1]|nr:hypothetical protein SBDP1_870004 [Syntrophobacter sp. SbD1]